MEQVEDTVDQVASVPFVDYLVLAPAPHLQANQCRSCAARFFDRRNACASCFASDFSKVAISTTGIVKSFSIVHTSGEPFVSAIVDCAGTSVGCILINVEPETEDVALGMAVRLATYSMGRDDHGIEAIGFGFEPT